jgi:hypothetical protein
MTGEAFRSWMKSRNLTVKGAARQLGVSLTSIKMWRSGHTSLGRMHLLALDGYDLEIGYVQPPLAGKLNDTSVRAIRRRFANGETARGLGEVFGVGEAAIRRVANRKSHADVS